MPVTFAGDYYGTTTATWNNDCTSNGAMNAFTTWVTWNQTTTATTTNVPAITWSGWNVVWDNGQPTIPYVAPPEEQARMRAVAEEQLRRSREIAERAAIEQREAIAKAKALLESMLTSEQIAQLAANRWFEVVSQHGRRYRINQGQTGNVQRLKKDGTHEARFCIHPGESVPDEDAMLAQMLLLRTDEDSFLKIANRS